ncbi:carbohydrate kinase family protein [Microbacterium sp.]|uniref:carbohydrate kinase family protein n=1 Tax=Microbacterium sp. TaxID=51671 RepID=UPI0028123A57|nr:carbohydrate kinase family protein [Microbacterium sp.]
MPDDVEVVLLGDLNIDLHLDIPAYPAPGGDGVASRQRMGFGGSAANTAVVLAALGVRTALIGCVGDDDLGAQAVAGLSATGVGTGLIRRTSEERTSLNVITVTPDGERTMFAYRGASAHLDVGAVPSSFSTARHLHVSGYALLAEPQRSAAIRAAAVARRSGLTVSLDVPVDPVSAVPEQLRAFLPAVDLVVIGSAEARRLMDADDDATAAERIAAGGVSLVALTRGAAGSLLWSGGQGFSGPVPAVRPVDSTGAGDSFCAGLIFTGLNGPADPALRAAFANACGAAAVAVSGAGAALAGRERIAAVVAALPDECRGALQRAMRAPVHERPPGAPTGAEPRLRPAAPA